MAPLMETSSDGKAEAEVSLAAEMDVDGDGALAINALEETKSKETDQTTRAEESIAETDSESTFQERDAMGGRDSKAGESTATLSLDHSEVTSVYTSASGKEKPPSSEYAYSLRSTAIGSLSSTSISTSKSSAPTPTPYAPPKMPTPNTLDFAHLPITGEYVPLPHEASGPDRKKLPVFRQPHTVGRRSHWARPIIDNRLYSW